VGQISDLSASLLGEFRGFPEAPPGRSEICPTCLLDSRNRLQLLGLRQRAVEIAHGEKNQAVVPQTIIPALIRSLTIFMRLSSE
jgi:hypothetical protein